MTNAEELTEEDTLKATKYPNFRVMRGGKGPPEAPPGDDWLSQLEVGSVFCARANERTVDWESYILICKLSPSLFVLSMDVPDGHVWTRRVDPKLFCNHHKDFQFLWLLKPNQEQEETNDPDPERDPVQSG